MRHAPRHSRGWGHPWLTDFDKGSVVKKDALQSLHSSRAANKDLAIPEDNYGSPLHSQNIKGYLPCMKVLKRWWTGRQQRLIKSRRGGSDLLEGPLFDDAHAHTKWPVIECRQGEPVETIACHGGNLRDNQRASQALTESGPHWSHAQPLSLRNFWCAYPRPCSACSGQPASNLLRSTLQEQAHFHRVNMHSYAKKSAPQQRPRNTLRLRDPRSLDHSNHAQSRRVELSSQHRYLHIHCRFSLTRFNACFLAAFAQAELSSGIHSRWASRPCRPRLVSAGPAGPSRAPPCR